MAEVDYDKIIYGTAEKVVESIPYAEKIDYNRINAGGVSEAVLSALVTAAVAKAMSNLDYDKLADAVREALNMDMIYRILEEGI